MRISPFKIPIYNTPIQNKQIQNIPMQLKSVHIVKHRVFRSRKQMSGFTLLELIITMSISSVIFTIILMGYRISMDTFDAQLVDANLWVELRDASALMSRDIRDASSIDTSSSSLLISFTSYTDGLTYSYYINGNNELVRQLGTASISGRAIVQGMDTGNTSVFQTGNLVTISLVAVQAQQIARLYTSVKPRNM